MSMMFGGITGMTNTNQQQGQNWNVAMQAARYLRRGGRRGSGVNSLSAQQQADLMTHGSQLRMDEATHEGNVRMTEVGNRAHVADQEYIRAHGVAPDDATGLVPGGHIGAARTANATFDKNGRHNGNTSWSMKPTAGGGLAGGASNAGTMNPPNPTTTGGQLVVGGQPWPQGGQPGPQGGQPGPQGGQPGPQGGQPGPQGGQPGPQGGQPGPQGGQPGGGTRYWVDPGQAPAKSNVVNLDQAKKAGLANMWMRNAEIIEPKEIEGRRQLPTGQRKEVQAGPQFDGKREPLALGSTRSPLELEAGPSRTINPKKSGKSRKVIGSVLKSVIPVAEEAGEAAL